MVPTAACQEKGMGMDKGGFWVLWWLPEPLLAALLHADVEVKSICLCLHHTYLCNLSF